jgi:peptide/nickel transport system permease protein
VTTAPPAVDAVLGDGALQSIEGPTFWRRLLRQPQALACIGYLLLVVGVALMAPLLMPAVAREPAGDLLAVRQGPSWHHLLGTDTLGRDILDRLLVGSRPTMVTAAEVILTVVFFGFPLGLAAGFLGGTFDRVVGWYTDLVLSMPGLVIVLVVLSVFPNSAFAAMVTFGLLASPFLIRVVRSATLPLRSELYIAAARVSGLSRPYIILRHVVPRVAGPMIVQTSLVAAGGVLIQAALAYLGVLVTPPAPSWGGMLNDGISGIVLQPWLIWPPGIAIALTVLAFGLLGDAVSDATAEAWSPAGPLKSRPKAAHDKRAPGQRLVEAPEQAADAALLSIRDLEIAFATATGMVKAVDGVSLDISAGEIVGLVGESGCGKTLTAMAILGLLPGSGEIVGGRILFGGQDLAASTQRQLEGIRGNRIGLISQEPMIGLNPTFRVGSQLSHLIRVHHGVGRREARARAVELLAQVQLPQPELVASRYPHELSGGMAQRVAIARALTGDPDLLIADEPTTALDVTVQSEILELLRSLRRERQLAVLLITHDWGVLADLCDRAIVMYAGEVVEAAEFRAMFRRPLHPYTQALLAANPHVANTSADLPAIAGVVPRPGGWPTGCHFRPRCVYATKECLIPIPLERPAPGRETRCIHYDVLARAH